MQTPLIIYTVSPMYRGIHTLELKGDTISQETLYEADISDLYYSSWRQLNILERIHSLKK